MIFELILTDSCNRNCDFCQIKKQTHCANIHEMEYFCNEVNDYKQKCSVNFFGGEPLLNIPMMEYCINNLNNDIKLNLYTNGDKIEQIYNKEYLKKLNIQVTVYDIFENYEKYQKMCENIPNLLFSYTFDQTNIHLIEEYKQICREKLNGNFKFVLSHSSDSWCNIENDKLCEKISEIVKNEIKDSIYNHKLSKFIESKVKRLIELKNNKDIKEFTCLDGDKKTFYRGKFLEIPCILYSDKNILIKNNYKKCLSCDYKKICTKSCYYECINGEVPEKLCLIEKSQFDVLIDYFCK